MRMPLKFSRSCMNPARDEMSGAAADPGTAAAQLARDVLGRPRRGNVDVRDEAVEVFVVFVVADDLDARDVELVVDPRLFGAHVDADADLAVVHERSGVRGQAGAGARQRRGE